MICASCFAESAATAAFCTRCGRAWPQTDKEPGTAAPNSPVPARAARAQGDQASRFRDLRRLRTWIVVLLVCLGGVLLLCAYQDLAQIRLIDAILSRSFGSQAELKDAVGMNDTRQQTLRGVNVAVFILTMIVFCMWVYRAAQNARAISTHKFEISPRMAVGSYFIPIVNLWLPYQAMSEIWRASRNPSSWRGDSAGTFLGWWWAVWIISSILGNVSFRITTREPELGDIRWSTQLSLVWEALDLVSVVMGVLLVTRLTAYQMQASTGESLHKVFE
jgi:hypothetical protein